MHLAVSVGGELVVKEEFVDKPAHKYAEEHATHRKQDIRRKEIE